MRKRVLVSFAVLTPAVLLTVLAGPARATIVVNGGFENPDIATNSWAVFQSIPGWVKTFGSGIEIQDNVAGSPFEGDQFVELDSHSNSGMAQILTTVAGQQYNLSFAFSPRPNQPATTNGISVFWDGSLVTNITAPGSSVTVWSVQSLNNLTASLASTVLEFRATGTSDSLGGYIDDVRVNAVVPEPSSLIVWSLIGLSFAGIGWRRRKAA